MNFKDNIDANYNYNNNSDNDNNTNNNNDVRNTFIYNEIAENIILRDNINFNEDNNNNNNNNNDELHNIIINEAYDAVERLGLQSLFIDNEITENLIVSDNRFLYLAREIYESGGTDHTGASFGAMCAHLARIFRPVAATEQY
jgi:hypothetical protein